MNEPKILGVAAWLSDRINVDVAVLRIIFVVATILGIGAPILIYLILYLIMYFDLI